MLEYFNCIDGKLFYIKSNCVENTLSESVLIKYQFVFTKETFLSVETTPEYNEQTVCLVPSFPMAWAVQFFTPRLGKSNHSG